MRKRRSMTTYLDKGKVLQDKIAAIPVVTYYVRKSE
jgi:hypothetical protein